MTDRDTITRIRQLVAEDTGRAMSLGADERLCVILAQHTAALRAERDKLTAQRESVCGALADAGNVLAVREDGNYAESVRELTKERDELRAKVAEYEAK